MTNRIHEFSTLTERPQSPSETNYCNQALLRELFLVEIAKIKATIRQGWDKEMEIGSPLQLSAFAHPARASINFPGCMAFSNNEQTTNGVASKTQKNASVLQACE